MRSTDHLTALRTINGSPATKRHVWTGDAWDTESYSAGSHFEWATAEVDSIEALSERLTAIEDQPEWFVVRGKPARTAKYLRRTYHHKDGGQPGFEPVDRRWICIDIDGMPAPEEGDPVQHAIAQLPDVFHGVACHWQWSSSAGIKDDVRIYLHLWYWLDRPACGFSLREWAKEIPHVDAMLYNPVQPHFTANPIIEGAPDPIRKRSGLLPGRADVVLPKRVVNLETWLDAWRRERQADKKRRKSAARRALANPDAPEIRRRYALKALDSACREIETAPVGDRHRTIFSQAAAVAELFDYLPETMARALLEETAAAVLGTEGRVSEAVRTVADGIAHGRGNPRDLSHVGALATSVDLDVDDDEDGGWLSAPPITCPKFEGVTAGCAHYVAGGGCALEDEFMCTEWMKINADISNPDHYRPPRAWWSDNA